MLSFIQEIHIVRYIAQGARIDNKDKHIGKTLYFSKCYRLESTIQILFHYFLIPQNKTLLRK